jgi:hypothetical protein
MTRTIRDTEKFPEAVRRMGDILLSMGIVDKYDLKWAMGRATELKRPLGEVLQELELATPEQIQLALDYQHRSR